MSERPSNELSTLAEPRGLRPDERALIEQLLAKPFPGRDEIASQLADTQVIAEGERDTRTLRFASPAVAAPMVPTKLRVPVEGIGDDEDAVPIQVLLHVVNGAVTELEIYRVDGQPIKRRDRLAIRTVSVNE
jgi:hypothetical protein